MNLPTLAILAGGLATRLRPVTETVPKSLVEVAGEPFLAHQLRLVARQGFRRIILLTGYLGEQIKAFAGDGRQFGLEIDYSIDGDRLRGTGGALRSAMPMLGDEFFVLYGDSYLDIDVAPIFQAYRAMRAPAMMTVLHNSNRWDRSNVEFDGAMVVRHDKTASGQPGIEWIDYGFSVFQSSVFAKCSQPDPFDLSALTRELASTGNLAGFAVSKRFYEIGTPEGRAETEAQILQKKTRD